MLYLAMKVPMGRPTSMENSSEREPNLMDTGILGARISATGTLLR